MAVYYRKDRDAWCVDVTDEWNRRRRKFLKSENAARALEASLKKAIIQCRSEMQRGELPDLRISEALQLYLASLPGTESTRSYNTQRVGAVMKLIGDPVIYDVTPKTLSEYQDRRRALVSPTTLAYEAQTLHRLFRFLVEKGYLQNNPAQTLPRKDPRISAGKEISYPDEQKILRACSKRIQLRLLLGFDAGLRRGEIMGMRRRDWDREKALLTIWRPKTKTLSQIPCTARLQAALKEIAGHLQPDSAIQSYGAKAVKKGTDALKGLRARTQVPFRLHDSRHTFATRLRRTAPFEVVRLLLGHSFRNTTERYIHPSTEDCRAAIAAMEQANPNCQKERPCQENATTAESPKAPGPEPAAES
jgi:integrase